MSCLKSKHLLFGSASFMYMIPFLFCSFLNWKFDELATNNALPWVAETFGISKPLAQWLQSAYFIATAAFAIPFNKLGDRFGVVIMCQWLISILAVVYISSAFMPSFVWLLVMKFLAGMLAGGAVANRNALVSKINYEKGAYFLANTVILNGIASVIIPLIAGAIIDARWQMIYVFSSGISVLAFLFSLMYTNPYVARKSISFDVLGSVLIVFGVGGVCAGLTLLSQKIYIYAGVCLAIAAIAIGVFCYVEGRHPEAVLPLFLMKNPVGDLALTHLLAFFSLSCNQYFLPQVFSHHNANAVVAGAVMTAAQVTNVLTAIAQKFLCLKFTNRLLMAVDSFLYIGCTIGYIFTLNNLVLYSVFYTLSVTFMTHANQIYYPYLLMSAPKYYTQLLAGIPTCARTIGNSLAYCFFTFLQELITQATAGSENDKFVISVSWCQGVNGFVGLILLLIIVFRIGNAEKEAGRIGYSVKQIRQLKIDEERVTRIRERYYARRGVVTLTTPQKVEYEVAPVQMYEN